MKARGLAVARSEAETARQRLRDAGALRGDLRVVHPGGPSGLEVVFPVREGYVPPLPVGRWVEIDFPRAPVPAGDDYRAFLSTWTEAERSRAPRAFDVVGDIVLVRLPSSLAARAGEVGAALREFVPGARIVGWDRGVHGVERRRSLTRIAGDGGWATRHRENGLEFDVDLESAYFSPRLAREHAEVAREVTTGERVYDLCCGVGPFALTIARDGRARSVTAVDSNLRATELVRRSAERLRPPCPVEIRTAEVEEFASSAPAVERVILNLPLEGIKYLPSVAALVAPAGWLHYYEVTGRGDLPMRAPALIDTLPGGGWELRSERTVHPYSPRTDLVAFTFRRGGS